MHTVRFRSVSTLALTLAVAACMALGVILLRNATRLDTETAFAAASVSNTALGDTDLQMYLRVEGVTGAPDDARHQNDAVVDSFSFATARNPSSSTPAMQDLVVTMPASAFSPKMMVYAAGSVSVPRVVLAVRRRGGNTDFVRWTLTDAFLSSFKSVGNVHGDGVQDQVSIAFGKVEVEYRQPLPDGTYGSAMKSGWDRRSNKPVSN